MASKRTTVTGQITAEPASGFASGQSTVGIPTEYTIVCKHLADLGSFNLDSDPAVNVPIVGSGGIEEGANLVKITVLGGYVTARLTSASGTAQVIVIEPEMTLCCKSIKYTALTIQRPTATPVQVFVTLGEKS